MDRNEADAIQQENEQLRQIVEEQAKGNDQMFLNDVPEMKPLASEKNFEQMTGVMEIPANYKQEFSALTAASTQWMYIKDPAEEEKWVAKGKHMLNTWKKFYNPDTNFTQFDQQQVLMFFQRYLNRAHMGFERNGINSVIHTMNYQATPIAPQAVAGAVKKLGFFDRINPFRR